MSAPRKILVTSALPYANGDIHIGHLVEYLQTDIWVRFQKLRGNNCRYFCADDTHGTAITISARNKGVSEEEFIGEVRTRHLADFSDFGICFDHYGSTNAPQSRAACEEIWRAIREAGLVSEKAIEQLYDTEAKTFLADRFVRGTCPKCGKPNQYGDNCECGAVYAPTELIDPVSTLSGTKPVIRTATHLFVELEKLHDFLDQWVAESGALQLEIVNYLKGQFLSDALHPWDISRPAPYFGFEIPDSPGNYWYVWYDAPIGYIGSTRQWCEANQEDYASWWKNPETEIHHFIGKDITYFHTLFWPAMLRTAGYNLPKKVHIHGFLTVDGEKMSKSKGTFIKARTYLNHLDPSYLRYFFASKTTSRVDDLDLNFEEFEAKVNADLVGNVVNLASRTAKFLVSEPLSTVYPNDGGLFERGAACSEEIAAAYEERDFTKALRLILEIGYAANKFIEENAPWAIRKQIAMASTDEEKARLKEQLRDTVTIALNLFRQIMIYLSPILPVLARKTEQLLNDKILSWDDVKKPLLGTIVNPFEHFMNRVPKEEIAAMIEESKAENTPASENTDRWNDSGEPLEAEPLADTITIDDFLKVDLRVGRIIEAEQVKEARKLLKLKISLGGGQTRQVFAGIKAAYTEPEKLVGRLIIFIANLQPRQMKFGLSEGMVVASGPGGEEVFLTFPDEGAKPGQRLH